MTKQNGFTLVELAIALMVIGLLIGGVLKGQELIENAKVTATIRQLKAYDTAAMMFRSTYNALAGDIKKPQRIPRCTEALCNLPGNGNGKVEYNDSYIANPEIYNFYPHLTKAGMVHGLEGSTVDEFDASMTDLDTRQRHFPAFPIDGYLIHTSWIGSSSISSSVIPHFTESHYHVFAQIYGKTATAIDNKMDDGHPRKGEVFKHNDGGTVNDACVTQDTNGQDIYSNSSNGCAMFVRANY